MKIITILLTIGSDDDRIGALHDFQFALLKATWQLERQTFAR